MKKIAQAIIEESFSDHGIGDFIPTMEPNDFFAFRCNVCDSRVSVYAYTYDQEIEGTMDFYMRCEECKVKQKIKFKVR